jgi:hypothetical protein
MLRGVGEAWGVDPAIEIYTARVAGSNRGAAADSLSIVLPARNEEANIGRAGESTVRASDIPRTLATVFNRCGAASTSRLVRS